MMLILLCIPVILWTFSLSRTMQTFKKPPLTVLLCLIVCFTLTSCFNTKNKSESVPDNEPVNHRSIHYAIPGRRSHYGFCVYSPSRQRTCPKCRNSQHQTDRAQLQPGHQ